jgi:hypothetical protein
LIREEKVPDAPDAPGASGSFSYRTMFTVVSMWVRRLARVFLVCEPAFRGIQLKRDGLLKTSLTPPLWRFQLNNFKER